MRTDLNCPCCGAKRYQYNYSMTTAMGWATIIEHGEVVSRNPNITTTYYTCLQCKHNFHTREQYDELLEVVDDGKAPEVPTIQVSVNEFNELDATTIPNSNDYIVKPDSTKLWATFPTMDEFKELKSRVERLEKRIKE